MHSILEKGTYGYIERFKRYELIKTVVWAIFIALIIGIPWLILKTQLNYFTIIGVVLVLPAARTFILYVAALPHHSGKEEEHEEIAGFVREPMILLSDLMLTRSKGSTIIVWEAVIYNGNVYAYVPKQKADIKEITAYLQKQMENLGYKRKPLVHDQFKAYSDLIEMLSVNHPSEVTECEDLARRLKAISL
ncbi:MAG TPA: hypothetical protein IAB63_09985 [Candidatus Onthocola gallistercoris]|uniref:Uncharacterized protein n=1 Tax=Candidatus Onthocola gallistercoris TaxID=2840876 RepID=A0A9D1HJY6_9FIRM|nr:hypothetical protein [Candidatus Onthocola gallistercoris]